jgi:hypothetical protein
LLARFCLIRITVLTSTFHFRAASACESCCDVTSKKISHFSSGDSCRRFRGLPFSITSSSWVRAPQASQDWHEKRPDLYHEVRRKPRARSSAGLEITAGAPKYTRRAAGIWSTNDLMRDAELELARQAEASYKRTVQDQQAGAPAKKAGASVTPERA